MFSHFRKPQIIQLSRFSLFVEDSARIIICSVSHQFPHPLYVCMLLDFRVSQNHGNEHGDADLIDSSQGMAEGASHNKRFNYMFDHEQLGFVGYWALIQSCKSG